MKKNIIFTLTISLLMASTAFCATLAPVSTKAASGAVLDASGSAAATAFVKFSKGVYAGANYNDIGYTLTTAHTSGTKFYGTGYDATAIYVKDAAGVVGATLAAPTDSNTATAFPTSASWTKL
jgi:hypothetical protein